MDEKVGTSFIIHIIRILCLCVRIRVILTSNSSSNYSLDTGILTSLAATMMLLVVVKVPANLQPLAPLLLAPALLPPSTPPNVPLSALPPPLQRHCVLPTLALDTSLPPLDPTNGKKNLLMPKLLMT